MTCCTAQPHRLKVQHAPSQHQSHTSAYHLQRYTQPRSQLSNSQASTPCCSGSHCWHQQVDAQECDRYMEAYAQQQDSTPRAAAGTTKAKAQTCQICASSCQCADKQDSCSCNAAAHSCQSHVKQGGSSAITAAHCWTLGSTAAGPRNRLAPAAAAWACPAALTASLAGTTHSAAG